MNPNTAAPHVPWRIAVPPEVYAEYCGVTMSRYHGDPATQMRVQLEGPQILHDKYGLPLRHAVSPDFTAYSTGSTLGLQIVFAEDHVAAPAGHPIGSRQEMARLQVPEDITEAGVMPEMLRFHQYMLDHAPDAVTVGFSTGTQGPFTTAVLLRGHDIFLDIHDEPDLVHEFMEKITENAIRQRELVFELTGSDPGDTIGFADDFGGLLPPPQYLEFDVKYLVQIAEHFGCPKRTIHTELLRRPHLPILQQHGWTFIDVGTDPYLTVKDCAEMLDIDFLVQMKTSDELLLATPEEIKQTYRQMVSDGASQMQVELCPGVPEENIHAFIEAARDLE